jgi:hypothetical protein
MIRSLAIGFALLLPAAAQQPRLVVHEWGTFTSLQDEDGHAVPGINSDDEPVPSFVHRVGWELDANGPLAPAFFQGAPRCHPDVTMRLETPVLYFHLPEGAKLPLELDVRVGFRGGWLTEFFPQAEADAPGVDPSSHVFGRMPADLVGRLRWQKLIVGQAGAAPETDAHVWLAPRQVRAADLVAANGEAERYLFYRGVGRIDAPLSVRRAGDRLELRDALPASLQPKSPMRIGRSWLLDARADGRIAWRELDPLVVGGRPGTVLAQAPATFADADYSAGRLDALRASMHAALVEDGMFADEATALLETWRLSYFQSSGQRLFFLAPRAWTDALLPLELSVGADVARSMVARIELVTPAQRELLAKIAAGPTSDARWLYERIEAIVQKQGGEAFRSWWEGLTSGRTALADAGVTIPPDYQAYLALGRFRNALVLDEQRRRPSAGMDRFIDVYALAGYAAR